MQPRQRESLVFAAAARRAPPVNSVEHHFYDERQYSFSNPIPSYNHDVSRGDVESTMLPPPHPLDSGNAKETPSEIRARYAVTDESRLIATSTPFWCPSLSPRKTPFVRPVSELGLRCPSLNRKVEERFVEPALTKSDSLSSGTVKCDALGVIALSSFLARIGCRTTDCVTPNDYAVRLNQALRTQFDLSAEISTHTRIRKPEPLGSSVPRTINAGQDEIESLQRTMKQLEFDLREERFRSERLRKVANLKPIYLRVKALKQVVSDFRDEVRFFRSDAVEAIKIQVDAFHDIPGVREIIAAQSNKRSERLVEALVADEEKDDSSVSLGPTAALRLACRLLADSMQSEGESCGVCLTPEEEGGIGLVTNPEWDRVRRFRGSELPILLNAINVNAWMIKCRREIQRLNKVSEEMDDTAREAKEELRIFRVQVETERREYQRITPAAVGSLQETKAKDRKRPGVKPSETHAPVIALKTQQQSDPESSATNKIRKQFSRVKKPAIEIVAPAIEQQSQHLLQDLDSRALEQVSVRSPENWANVSQQLTSPASVSISTSETLAALPRTSDSGETGTAAHVAATVVAALSPTSTSARQGSDAVAGFAPAPTQMEQTPKESTTQPIVQRFRGDATAQTKLPTEHHVTAVPTSDADFVRVLSLIVHRQPELSQCTMSEAILRLRSPPTDRDNLEINSLACYQAVEEAQQQVPVPFNGKPLAHSQESTPRHQVQMSPAHAEEETAVSTPQLRSKLGSVASSRQCVDAAAPPAMSNSEFRGAFPDVLPSFERPITSPDVAVDGVSSTLQNLSEELPSVRRGSIQPWVQEIDSLDQRSNVTQLANGPSRSEPSITTPPNLLPGIVKASLPMKAMIRLRMQAVPTVNVNRPTGIERANSPQVEALRKALDSGLQLQKYAEHRNILFDDALSVPSVKGRTDRPSAVHVKR